MGENQLIPFILSIKSKTDITPSHINITLRAVEKGCFVDGCMQLAALVDDQVTGCIDLYNYDPIHCRAEVGIVVESSWRRKGCATAMLHALEVMGVQNLRLHQLYADVVATNTVSVHLFEQCGYRQVGVMKEWVLVKDEYLNVVRLQKILKQ